MMTIILIEMMVIFEFLNSIQAKWKIQIPSPLFVQEYCDLANVAKVHTRFTSNWTSNMNNGCYGLICRTMSPCFLFLLLILC